VESSCEHGSETAGSVKCWEVVAHSVASRIAVSSRESVSPLRGVIIQISRTGAALVWEQKDEASARLPGTHFAVAISRGATRTLSRLSVCSPLLRSEEFRNPDGIVATFLGCERYSRFLCQWLRLTSKWRTAAISDSY
jgi:hypothetical protein